MPGQMISINVKGGDAFCIHKDVLIRGSQYFMEALGGPFGGGQTNTIHLDDVSPDDFGLYVGAMYPLVLCKNSLEMHDIWPVDTQGMSKYHPWAMILTLWHMGDRFRDRGVLEMASAELVEKLGELSVQFWQDLCERSSEADLKALMLNLQTMFRKCKEEGWPFWPGFVAAASNAPPEIFAMCVEDLDDEVFRLELTKAFAWRHAELESTIKQSRIDERREKRQNKRQRRV
ncbi:hypothetical protein J7T55_001916 [Diaporthe amygdali]|uniref:uncharacterized protein n=1 Tax=Phomopsis amygdali TaxID=1214568 RepID=UPI0022FDB283|nr:uncharacterized protein J7T55_001916 [Diaporthe amygdali]KAJ0117716.1 hypothetical protein J7T55_001916 [Diaporthe amygdali]